MRRSGNRYVMRAPVDEIRKLYESGLSCRQVEKLTGWSASRVNVLVKDIVRSMQDAAILRQPAKSKHPRSSRAAARKKVERLIGRKLLRLEHVHHKDLDPSNNDIDNLEIHNATDHQHIHHPLNPVPRHLRPERKAYMREYFRAYRKRASQKA